ncbi:MAG: hypothetical protein VKJ04_00375 [Vampirovibrionales bacterium]|nr:hypothetical protein [Vampirovibrionales bacterium]
MRFKNSIQPFILFYGRALSPDFQAFLSQIALIISIKTILGIFVRPPQRTDTPKMMKRYRLWVVGYFQKCLQCPQMLLIVIMRYGGFLAVRAKQAFLKITHHPQALEILVYTEEYCRGKSIIRMYAIAPSIRRIDLTITSIPPIVMASLAGGFLILWSSLNPAGALYKGSPPFYFRFSFLFRVLFPPGAMKRM